MQPCLSGLPSAPGTPLNPGSPMMWFVFPFWPNHLNWIQKSLYPPIILWYIYTLPYLPLYLESQDFLEGILEDQFKTQFLKVNVLKKVKQY